MIAELVYLLCAVTSVGCAVLLLRSYRASRNRMLFWSGTFFALLAISNLLLFVDLVIVPESDLSLIRTSITVIAHILLVFGLISKPS